MFDWKAYEECGRTGAVSMEDSFNKLVDICIKNDLAAETANYLFDIKKLLKEREKLEKAFELACKKLEDNDSILFDLYDRFDTYHPTHDRYEWKEHLLESVEANE